VRVIRFRPEIALVCLSGDDGMSLVDTHGNLKVHQLLGKCRHFVVEAEPILALIVRREDKVALLFLLSFHYRAFVGPDDRVVDVKGAAGLNLRCRIVSMGRESTTTAASRDSATDMAATPINLQRNRMQPLRLSAGHRQRSMPSRGAACDTSMPWHLQWEPVLRQPGGRNLVISAW
jgi:hypothetical protein